MFDPKTKFKLFKQHKHFCSAPWTVLYVGMNGYTKTCTNDYSKHNSLLENSIEEIVVNKEYQTLRSDILKDKVTDHCKRCLSFENKVSSENFESIRNMYNLLSVDSDVDYEDVTQFKLNAVDLHWSSTCDLKCVTCWAGQSSSIAKEQGKTPVHTPTAIADQIIKYIVANQTELKEIYLSGGEPTLIKYNLKLLQQIEKRDDLLIRVNTNMQWNQDNAIMKEILKFPKVMMTCSADGIGEKFNYIRRGGTWKKFSDNLDYLKTYQNVDIRANTVFFVLTAQELPDIIDYFIEKQGAISHTVNMVSMGQDHLRCRHLPIDIKNRVRHSLKKAFEKYNHDLNIAGNLKNCINELDNTGNNDYQQYFDDIDLLQGSNWRKLYPELV
jgi:organic radical activating enzyme